MVLFDTQSGWICVRLCSEFWAKANINHLIWDYLSPTTTETILVNTLIPADMGKMKISDATLRNTTIWWPVYVNEIHFCAKNLSNAVGTKNTPTFLCNVCAENFWKFMQKTVYCLRKRENNLNMYWTLSINKFSVKTFIPPHWLYIACQLAMNHGHLQTNLIWIRCYVTQTHTIKLICMEIWSKTPTTIWLTQRLPMIDSSED